MARDERERERERETLAFLVCSVLLLEALVVEREAGAAPDEAEEVAAPALRKPRASSFLASAKSLEQQHRTARFGGVLSEEELAVVFRARRTPCFSRDRVCEKSTRPSSAPPLRRGAGAALAVLQLLEDAPEHLHVRIGAPDALVDL